MTTGERLRQWRTAAGLSTTQAARAAGLNQSYISQLENDRHTPSGATVLKLARAYNCPAAALVTGAPELQASTAAVAMRSRDAEHLAAIEANYRAELARVTAAFESRMAEFESRLGPALSMDWENDYQGDTSSDALTAALEDPAGELEPHIWAEAGRAGRVEPAGLAAELCRRGDFAHYSENDLAHAIRTWLNGQSCFESPEVDEIHLESFWIVDDAGAVLDACSIDDLRMIQPGRRYAGQVPVFAKNADGVPEAVIDPATGEQRTTARYETLPLTADQLAWREKCRTALRSDRRKRYGSEHPKTLRYARAI